MTRLFLLTIISLITIGIFQVSLIYRLMKFTVLLQEYKINLEKRVFKNDNT